MYKIYLFGFPRIEHDGTTVHIPRRKSIALLAYLVVTRLAYQRDKLATLLYPDYDQGRARSNLRRDIFDLKSALAGQILLLERDSIGLQSTDTYWVDVNEFLNQLQHAHLHHPQSNTMSPIFLCADCQSRLSRAVELYSDNFMAGFSISDSREFEDWQFFQSEELHKKLAEILNLLVRWHTDQSEFSQALNYARRVLTLDTLNEPAHRDVMRLYTWSGQQPAALRQYSELKQLLRHDLGTEPDGETNALYETILRQNLEPPHHHISPITSPTYSQELPSQSQNNLPFPDGPLIGRDHELELALHDLRDEPNCHILTILGPGGIGKTRLAIEVAMHLANDKACPFCEGIYYVSLAGMTQPEMIILAIASTLKLSLVPEPDQRSQQLFNFLHTKRMLLLLDNFEQLIDPQSIQILGALIRQVPQIKLLITSRTRLNIHSEHLLSLHGLDIPKIPPGQEDISSDSAGEFAAIQLFQERARILNPDYKISPEDIKPIISICNLVAGMPLGIELAAAWLDLYSPPEILHEIKHSLDFLTIKWPDRPEKHHSLHAVFDSSWNLLTQQERSALMRLTVFQGSFTRPSALAVSGATPEILQAIKNKSWLKTLNEGAYQIHELLCQFASEKLQADVTAWEQTRQSYTDYYLTSLDQQWIQVKGPGQREAFDWISSEFENIRLAWQWLIELGQEELAVQHLLPVLYRYSETRAKPFELIQIFDSSLSEAANITPKSSPSLVNSILMVTKASFNVYGYPIRLMDTVNHTEQEMLIRRAWQSIGDLETLQKIGFLGMLAAFLYGLLVDTPEAIRNLQVLSTYYRMRDDDWNLACALSLLGSVQVLNYTFFTKTMPFPVSAEPILNEALGIFRKLEDKSESSYVLEMVGMLHLYEGKYHQAIEMFQAALDYQDQVGEFVVYSTLMSRLADAYARLGDHQAALRCFRQASIKLLSEGHNLAAAGALHQESLHCARHADLDQARRIRQESIALYQQVGNEIGTAWGMWEMGEIYRIGGDLTQAQDWYSQARLLFTKIGGKSSDIFLARAEGDLALITGDWQSAKAQFERSAKLANEMNHLWALSYALCGLAIAEDRLSEFEVALQHIRQAVHIARKMDHQGLLLNALAVYTQHLVASGEVEQAVELATWILDHKLTWNETRNRVNSLLSQVHLSPQQLDACRERSKTLDFDRALSIVDQI